MYHRSTLQLPLPKVHYYGTPLCSKFYPHNHIDTNANAEPNVIAYTITDAIIATSIDAKVNSNVYEFCDIVRLSVDSVTNTHRVIFYRGRSSTQPHYRGVDDTR
ncbi:hypothetical protein J1N35_043023 [Gossypium stocksii]|uniref:Uncharacterized protein n=1 Tax=Gossypium stocksii TaxID=47602 RepID=A0A9D3U6P0_9ROSI|nr:hypothetical protein J1N35_043023 [Gossypium stocksii]